MATLSITSAANTEFPVRFYHYIRTYIQIYFTPDSLVTPWEILHNGKPGCFKLIQSPGIFARILISGYIENNASETIFIMEMISCWCVEICLFNVKSQTCELIRMKGCQYAVFESELRNICLMILFVA